MLLLKIDSVEEGQTLLSRVSGNWDIGFEKVRECEIAIAVMKGLILNVYKIVDVWESSEESKRMANERRKQFQLAECREYSYLISKTFRTSYSNPATTIDLATVLNEVQD